MNISIFYERFHTFAALSWWFLGYNINIIKMSLTLICNHVCLLNTYMRLCSAAPALRHNGRGDVPAGPDVVRRLAGRLPGHSGPERPGCGADETTQARQRGNMLTCVGWSDIIVAYVRLHKLMRNLSYFTRCLCQLDWFTVNGPSSSYLSGYYIPIALVQSFVLLIQLKQRD